MRIDVIIDASKRTKRRMEAAQGYLMLDLPDRALSELAEIAAANEKTFDYHLLRGEALRSKTEHHAALDAFHLALEIRPADLSALMGLAWCFKRTGQLNRSIETMLRAYDSHRDEPIVMYNLACYYSLAGEKDSALSWLGRALRMDRGLTKLIPKESDFDPLRDDPDFLHLLELTTT